MIVYLFVYEVFIFRYLLFDFGHLQCGDDSVMKQLQNSRVNNQYTPEVRTFALTLHFYSPRAYRYVRNKFKNKLPAPRTIRQWCESVNGDPGITKEALNVLSVKIKDSQDKGLQLRFCMAVDEMSIRKQIEFNFTRKKYFGYVDFGGSSVDRENTVAAYDWVIGWQNSMFILMVKKWMLD